MTKRNLEEDVKEYLRLSNDPDVQDAIRQIEEEWFLKAELAAAYKKGFEIGLKEAKEKLAKEKLALEQDKLDLKVAALTNLHKEGRLKEVTHATLADILEIPEADVAKFLVQHDLLS